MLYIFAGYLGKSLPPGMAHLHAGGLRHCVQEVEQLADLEDDPMITYTKEGVYAIPNGSNEGEWLRTTPYHISPAVESTGITWDWFPERWNFGNGITCANWVAEREQMLIDYRTGMPLAEIIATGNPLDMSKVIIQQIPRITEGWTEYERRWKPGTCPQESHKVHLTYMVTRGEVAPWAYERVRLLIEENAVLVDVDRYIADHFTQSRVWHPNKAALSVPGLS